MINIQYMRKRGGCFVQHFSAYWAGGSSVRALNCVYINGGKDLKRRIRRYRNGTMMMMLRLSKWWRLKWLSIYLITVVINQSNIFEITVHEAFQDIFRCIASLRCWHLVYARTCDVTGHDRSLFNLRARRDQERRAEIEDHNCGSKVMTFPVLSPQANKHPKWAEQRRDLVQLTFRGSEPLCLEQLQHGGANAASSTVSPREC